MPGQRLAINLSLLRQRVVDAAHGDHFHAAKHSALQRFGDLVVKEQQTQIGTTLHQFARHLALGRTGQLHLQAGKALSQRFEAFDDRLVRHGLILSQTQTRLLPTHHRQRPAIEALTLTQHFPRFFQQGVAGFGEFRLSATAAIEQADAQVFLQQRDRTADRRLRLALVPCHGGKRTLLRHADEQAQLLQVPLHTHAQTHLNNR